MSGRSSVRAAGRLALVLCCLGQVQADAQVRVERAAAFDREGQVLEITPSLRSDIGLFPEVDGFRAARLFAGADGTWSLDITCRVDGGPGRQLRTLSRAQVDSLRQVIALHLVRPRAAPGLDQSGRGELILDHLLLSLSIYGPAAAAVVDADGPRTFLATYMLTAAGGFYVPYQLTRDREVGRPHRSLAQYGGTRGVAYGILLHDVLFGSGGDRDGAAMVVGGSLLSSLAGFHAAGRLRPSRGQASLYGIMGDFGLLTGLGLAYSTRLFGDGDGPFRAGDLVALTGAGAGLYLGGRLGRQHPYTRGDAWMLRSTGVAGAVAALPLVNLTGTQSSRAHVAGAIAGEVAGVAVGHRLLASQDFTFSEGLIATGGQLAGALLGLGLTYLADTGGHFDELAYMGAAAAGSAAGLTFTWRVFAR